MPTCSKCNGMGGQSINGGWVRCGNCNGSGSRWSVGAELERLVSGGAV